MVPLRKTEIYLNPPPPQKKKKKKIGKIIAQNL